MAVMQELGNFLSDVEHALRSIDDGVTTTSDFDSLLLQSEWLLRDVLFVEDLLPRPHGEVLSCAVAEVVVDVQAVVDEEHRTHTRGRPAITISEEHLAFLLDHHFSLVDIARMLQVSSRTIRRRIIQYGLEEEASHSNISDNDLDEITKVFVEGNPHSGQRSYEGFLRSSGLRIQRLRIRESLLRVDVRGVEQRFRRVLHRRQYNVCMPNSLWHIDGHHKLIRWRIVTHGGIDGFSRLPVYLCASDNNRADTVLQNFLGGVNTFGLPSRVRCDKGGENVLVSQFMLNHPHRGPGRGSCITGRSVHNQRIERFWRDLYPGCISLYYDLFFGLEDEGLLDVNDGVDLFCLHYIFLPRLNHHLTVFSETYSHHRIRTAGNHSPYQLWIVGMAERGGDWAAIHGVEEGAISNEYGIDWSGPPCMEGENEGVEVPHTECPLSSEELQQLKHAVDPLEECDDYGISLFVATKAFVLALLTA